MPLKNYTTEVPANRSIEEIQSNLVRCGATGMMFQYEQGTGRISALVFRLPVQERNVSFSLPVNWRSFQAVLKRHEGQRQEARRKFGKRIDPIRWQDEDYVYRVAWRNIRDWVLAQLALYETQIVDLPQIFLPFATGKNGQTLYDQVKSTGFLLSSGDDKPA